MQIQELTKGEAEREINSLLLQLAETLLETTRLEIALLKQKRGI